MFRRAAPSSKLTLVTLGGYDIKNQLQSAADSLRTAELSNSSDSMMFGMMGGMPGGMGGGFPGRARYWASEYIRLAVQEGWMTGYTDRTFRSNQMATLEEACTAALKLLGYDSSSLAGSFPYAQLSKASALGLRDQLTKQKGQTLTVGDCAQLFYNLLTAKTSSGQVYGPTLGYTVQVFCTDGIVHAFTAPINAISYKEGRLVSVNISQNGTTIKGLSEKSISGKVNADATKLDSLTIAKNVQIMDTSGEGGQRLDQGQAVGGGDPIRR